MHEPGLHGPASCGLDHITGSPLGCVQQPPACTLLVPVLPSSSILHHEALSVMHPMICCPPLSCRALDNLEWYEQQGYMEKGAQLCTVTDQVKPRPSSL